MARYRSKYLWIALILFVIFVWANRNEIGSLFQREKSAESLDINRPLPDELNRPLVVSGDEEIHMRVFENVHPAVVNIATTTLGMNFWMEIIPREGQGSGFIIDREGYILTNNHVVAKAQKIVVTMANGSKISARLIGRDPRSDLAVIKIPANRVDVVARLADSQNLKVGQKTIAIGNPFGLSHTMTTGIISALNRGIRTEEGYEIEELIQTDAAINPGNSGGPLLNSSGEVIGINTAIYSVSGGYQGIGFAIPAHIARDVATQIITSGRVARPWLGITGISINKGLAQALGLPAEQGVLVVEAIPDGPAHQAGIRGGDREVIAGGMRLLLGGDIITAIDGEEVPGMKELLKKLDRFKVNETLRLKISRDGRPMEIEVLLWERP
jgi:putative serine protease PepD